MIWNLIIGPACLLVGMLIALYVKDSAREVAKKQFTEQIAAALAVFKNDLIESLDKVYVRTNLCDLMMETSADRADIAAKRLDSIDDRFNSIKNTRRENH